MLRVSGAPHTPQATQRLALGAARPGGSPAIAPRRRQVGALERPGPAQVATKLQMSPPLLQAEERGSEMRGDTLIPEENGEQGGAGGRSRLGPASENPGAQLPGEGQPRARGAQAGGRI